MPWVDEIEAKTGFIGIDDKDANRLIAEIRRLRRDNGRTQMTRTELIGHIARISGLWPEQAEAALIAIIQVEAEAERLRRGEDLVGYHEVSAIIVISREARNLATELDKKSAGDA